MESEKKPTPISFRPKEHELEQIRLIQERKGCSQAGAIRFALDAACEVLEPQEEPQPDTDWKAMYLSEKKLNESLSSRLMELSEKVADSYRPRKCFMGSLWPSLRRLRAKKLRKPVKAFGGA